MTDDSRQAGKEIEITDAMIEAGVAAIDPYDEEFLSPYEKVKLVLTSVLVNPTNCVERVVK